MRFACQGYRSQHCPAMRFDISAQIGECAAHAYEIIYHNVLGTLPDYSIKFRLTGQPRESVCPSVRNDIYLNHTTINFPA